MSGFDERPIGPSNTSLSETIVRPLSRSLCDGAAVSPGDGRLSWSGLALGRGRARGCNRSECSVRIGAEIVLSVDGEWRRSRLFRSHEQAELVGAISDTRTMFEGKGWA